MKRPYKPIREQKEYISRRGYDPTDYLVVESTPERMLLINRNDNSYLDLKRGQASERR